MPIKHLQAERPAAFPCIGKLRKGGTKRTNDKGKEIYGLDLDHFRFTSDDPDALTMFGAYYGAEPKAINVFLPYPTTDENFQAWLEEYRAGGLVRRCDGESCVFSRNEKGQPVTTPTPCHKPACACKQVGRLAVIIPQLARMAYVTVETHSVWDIISLTENLQAAQVLRGDLRGIPFILSRREREISTPTGEDGKRARRKKWLLFIEPDPSWVQRQLEAMRIAALPQIDQPLLALTPRLLVDSHTGEVLAGGSAWTSADEDDEEEEEGDVWTTTTSAAPAQPTPSRAPRGTVSNPLPPVKPPAPLVQGAPGSGGDSSSQPTGPGSISPATLARLNELGVGMYAEQWPTKEREIALSVTTGAAEKLYNFTFKEGEDLLKIFEKRAAERQAAEAQGVA